MSFRDTTRVPITARLGPPIKTAPTPSDRATHTANRKENCKRYNVSKCMKGEDCIFAHVCWHQGCLEDHPTGASQPPRQSLYLMDTHGTPQRSEHRIQGPFGLLDAKNLSSAFKHLQITDAELAKECAAGRILGPFPTRPLKNLRSSRVGIVPKQENKWRMIMHLSAPLGSSINDYIPGDDFSLHYASLDDAVWLLLSLGTAVKIAKVDLKSAFRMVPVTKEDWELLGIHWRRMFCIDTCLPFGLC